MVKEEDLTCIANKMEIFKKLCNENDVGVEIKTLNYSATNKYEDMVTYPLILDQNFEVATFDNFRYIGIGRVEHLGYRSIDITGSGERVMVNSMTSYGARIGYVDVTSVGALTQVTTAALMLPVLGHTLLPDVNIIGEITEMIPQGRLTGKGTCADYANNAEQLLNVINNAEKGKMTAYHHLHINPTQAVIIVAGSPNRNIISNVITYLSSINNITKTTLITIAVYLSSVEGEVFNTAARILKAFDNNNSVKQLNTYLKSISATLKQAQHVVGLDLAQLFELNVLINRGTGDVDWKKEQLNRTELHVVEVRERDVYDEAVKLFRRAEREKVKYFRKTFDQWKELRLFTVPGGAAHSENPKLLSYINEHKRDTRFNKKVLMSIVDINGIEELLSRAPRIAAWPSVKYEWGTERAIYGTDVDSYILADLCLGNCEHMFPSQIVGGANMEEKTAKKIVEFNLDNMLPLCYDYEDFNSQHSVSSMNAVLEAFTTVFGSKMSEDQAKAMDWTRRSLNRMIIKGNQTLGTTSYEAKGTLLSGWRLTTFMNSMLNRIYLQAAGSLDHAISAIHAGDDVLASTISLSDALMFFRKAKRFGIRAQVNKTNYGSVAEFLRIDHKGEQTSTQYLTRACATVVHSRMETTLSYNPVEYIEATKVRFENMLSRGGTNMKITWEMLTETIRNTQTVSRTSIEYVMALGRIEGGISDNNVLTGIRIHVPGAETRARDESSTLVKSMGPGITSAARRLKIMLSSSTVSESRIKDRLERALDNQFSFTKKKIEVQDYVPTARDYENADAYGMWGQVAKASIASTLKGVDRQLYKLALAAGSPMSKAVFSQVTDFDRVVKYFV